MLSCQKTQHIGEMKPLSNTDDSLHPPIVNEIIHGINSNHIDAQWIQPASYPSTLFKICSNM